MIVDDELSFIEGLQKVLKLKGYCVDMADNGNTAIELLKSKTYEWVITDIIMPEVDGIELIIKLSKEYPDVRIIGISGGGRISADIYLEAAQKLGAHKVLKKPFTTQQLINVIENKC